METTDGSIQAEQNPGPGEQRVDIAELLVAMKCAVERMSNQNTHRGVMVTAGSVIIHMIGENSRLIEENRLLQEALIAAREALKPLVSLT